MAKYAQILILARYEQSLTKYDKNVGTSSKLRRAGELISQNLYSEKRRSQLKRNQSFIKALEKVGFTRTTYIVMLITYKI